MIRYKQIIIIMLSVCFSIAGTSYAEPEIYTVKPSDGDYATPGDCANAISPGAICEVYTGSYPGWSQTQSGTDNDTRIIVRAAEGQAPVITISTIDCNAHKYITIKGMEIQTGVIGQGCSFIAIIDNTFTNTDIGIGGSNAASELDGNDILIDGNYFGDRGDDVIKGNGDRWVIRNNIGEDIDDSENEHIDFFQDSCKNLPSDYVLIENNKAINFTGPDTHFWLINCTTGTSRNHIIRRNIVYNMGSTGVSNTETGSGTIIDEVVYNNTFVRTFNGSGTRATAIAGSAVGGHKGSQNNIYYDALTPSNAIGSTLGLCDGSLVYDPDFEVRPRACLEDSEGVISNEDPLFNGMADHDFSLKTDSPAIDKGHHLTLVAAADTGSDRTLVVDNPVYFQPGWAGTKGDTIAIGSITNIARITGIDYSHATLTLDRDVSRNEGDKIWLYAGSSGERVLYGDAPDIGAVESGSTSEITPPSRPENLRVVE